MAIEYRWLASAELSEWVNPVCKLRGWAELNINDAQPTCRVLGAFDGVEFIGFLAFQLFPVVGPQWVDSDHRDGTVSRELASRMHDFLSESNARGFMVVADSPVSGRICERHGMKKLESTVYVEGGM